MEDHIERSCFLHSALSSGAARCSLHGGPGAHRQVDQRQAVHAGYHQAGGGGKYFVLKHDFVTLAYCTQVGQQWLTTELDQAGNIVEKI